MTGSTYDYVIAKLDETSGLWRIASRESGVPYSTLTRIARRRTKNPSVHTIEQLARYFRKQDRVTT